MKKIFGFLGMALLMSLASCSNDDFLDGTQTGGGSGVGTKGDLYMTMNIAQASVIGTRTATPNQGYEVGKDYENTISSALVLLCEENSTTGGYTIKFASGNIASGNLIGNSNVSDEEENPEDDPESDGNDIQIDPSHTSTYKTSFTLNRENVLADIAANGDDATSGQGGTKKTYYIFVVANPSPSIITAATPAEGNQNPDLQQLITEINNSAIIEASETANEGVFWKKNNFLMSSANPAKHTIKAEDIPLGTHTTKAEAYPLGKVYVQRAMSRFDINTDATHTTFEGEGDGTTGQSGINNIKVEFDAVAMVNMAKSAYLFKVMSESAITTSATYPTKFGDERESTFEDWWTVTPNQENTYFNQLFPGQTGSGSNLTQPEGSSMAALKGFFATGADYQLVSSLTVEDETFEHEGHNTPQNLGAYKIWRYAMENTNPFEIENQVNGNSTGIIFRAKLTESNPGENPKIPTTFEDNDSENAEAIYAYNNVILGTAEQLFTYATNAKAASDNSGVYEAVNNIYWGIINPLYEANKKSGDQLNGQEWTYEDGWKSTDDAWWIQKTTTGSVEEGGTVSYTYHHPEDLSVLDTELVKQGFNIYRPEVGKAKVKEGQLDEDGDEQDVPVYYCYYIYWNRHNDNGLNTVMGTMEFATVRNNVYKLSVNKVFRLGHPGQPSDDPYPPTPGTPDEKDEFWLEVECHILPWEVRVNNIDF